MKEIDPMKIILPFWLIGLLSFILNIYQEWWTVMQVFKFILLGFMISVAIIIITRLGINPYINEKLTQQEQKQGG